MSNRATAEIVAATAKVVARTMAEANAPLNGAMSKNIVDLGETFSAALVEAVEKVVPALRAGDVEKFATAVSQAMERVNVTVSARMESPPIEITSPTFAPEFAPVTTIEPRVVAEIDARNLVPEVRIEAQPGDMRVVLDLAEVKDRLVALEGKLDQLIQTARAERAIELRDADNKVVRRGSVRVRG